MVYTACKLFAQLLYEGLRLTTVVVFIEMTGEEERRVGSLMCS